MAETPNPNKKPKNQTKKTYKKPNKKKPWDTPQVSLESQVVHLIAGNGDYKKGINSIEKLRANPLSQHGSYSNTQPQGYEGRSQLKFYIALVQLTYNDFRCAYCQKKIDKNDPVILSHNYGHNDNLKTNLRKHNKIRLDQTNTTKNMMDMIDQNHLFSIFHSPCNQTHFEEKKDAFSALDFKVAPRDMYQFKKGSLSGATVNYWLSDEVKRKIEEHFAQDGFIPPKTD